MNHLTTAAPALVAARWRALAAALPVLACSAAWAEGNPYTIGAMENIVILGDTLYFDIVHQDWGESDPPTFNRNIVARVVQNEMPAATLGKDLVIDPANPPARDYRNY